MSLRPTIRILRIFYVHIQVPRSTGLQGGQHVKTFIIIIIMIALNTYLFESVHGVKLYIPFKGST